MVDLNKIAGKWQKRWEEKGIFKTKEGKGKKKFYVLEMFPYPSGGGLHMGHLRNYAMGDSFARYKRMKGFNVLYPMGYDSFGLPAENAAIKQKVNPRKWTENNIKKMEKQQKSIGLSYDWSRKIMTHSEEYYKWNQWIFLKFFEKGLAYRKEAPVNWCPGCKTVLANEQVTDGKCWRCKSESEMKLLEQWFFRTKDYARELLDGLEKLKEWPEKVKTMQENWIGRSEGTKIYFRVKSSGEIIPIFTTRADTLFGVTFMVFAPEHPLVRGWVKGTKYEKDFLKFLKEVKQEDKFERTAEDVEKKGMFIGKYAINPATSDEIPVYVGNFVVYEYGAGAVMAVPAHDQRDFEFAKKFKIPIKVVIQPSAYKLNADKMSRAYVEDGTLVNSGEFNGSGNRNAIKDISKFLEKKKLGGRTINYKLRDWLISRQRYWGTPIPIVYCEKCGVVPVSAKDLPILLPKDVKFAGGGNPLESSRSFLNCKCPKCKGKGRRETDTMDTFVDSSWYFLRYCSPAFKKMPFDSVKVNYWMPADQYIGGIEHACMHLMYARFFTKALRDLGLVKVHEPFSRLLCQGMVLKDGVKMSKSLGNVVEPEVIMGKFGADTARLFILFAALPEKELEWSDEGVEGCFKFLNRVYGLLEDVSYRKDSKLNSKDKHLLGKMHRTIEKVEKHIEKFELSLAIGAVMELVKYLIRYKREKVNKKVYSEVMKNLVLVLSPFAPHLTEEMNEKLGEKGFVSSAKWPAYDLKKIDLKAEVAEEAVHIVMGDIAKVLELTGIKKPSKIKLFISDRWKYDFISKFKKILGETRNPGEIMKKLIVGEMKKQGKEISKLVPMLVKDLNKLPEGKLDQKSEILALEENKELISEEFGCPVEIVVGSSEEKAKKAMPGKVGVLVE